MKKIFILLLSASLIVWSGCEKDFEPIIKGQLTPANFPKTEGDFELYTLAAYEPFGSRFQYYNSAANGQKTNFFFAYEYGVIMEFDYPTDLLAKFPDWGGQFAAFSTPDFTFLKTQDQQSHFDKVRYVTRMTKIIDDLEKSTLSEEKKNQLMAEARTGRGITMFYLLHMYGAVPVILDPTEVGTEAENDLTRPDRADYVAAVGADLDFASTYLPGKGEEASYGRFTKGVALGYLMRLYLNEKDWIKAEQAGRKLLTLGYNLVDNYAGLFREVTEVNDETIWAIVCAPSNQADNNLTPQFNSWPWYCLPSDFKSIDINGGWAGSRGAFTGTWTFYDTFHPLDQRRSMLIGEYTNKEGQPRDRTNMPGPVIRKYPDESGQGSVFQGNDIPVLRYADVLLMLAEAINQQNGPTGEAIDFVNQVRLQHGGAAIGGLSPDEVASKEAFNDAILRERGWDLFFEGVRKIDLLRHGKWQSALASVGKSVIPANAELLPIPQYAISVSNGKLSQNTGY